MPALRAGEDAVAATSSSVAIRSAMPSCAAIGSVRKRLVAVVSTQPVAGGAVARDRASSAAAPMRGAIASATKRSRSGAQLPGERPASVAA